MTRNKDYKNYVFGVDHTNVDFELTSITLQIEHLLPSDTALIAINDFLTKTDTIDVHFRAKGCKFDPNNTGTDISLSGFKYANPRYFIMACKDPAKKNKCEQNFG